MKLNTDSIIFESRREIEAIMSALIKYEKDHPKADNIERVEELIDKLDVMHMNF